MIEKFTGGSSDVENMIDIQFQQTAAQDKTSKFDYDFHSYGHVIIWRQLYLEWNALVAAERCKALCNFVKCLCLLMCLIVLTG